MRISTLGKAACVLALAGAAAAQEGPVGKGPQLVLMARTVNMAVPGLPGDLLAQRTLHVALWTPGAAPLGASASLQVPPALKLGAALPLAIEPAGPPAARPKRPELGMDRYWGSGAVARTGQPKHLQASELSALEAALERSGATGAGEFGTAGVPGWTDAHWPNAGLEEPPMLASASALPGAYEIRGTYVQPARFEVPAGVDFLDAVTSTVPKGGPELLRSAIPVSWKPVPRALGYLVVAFGLPARRGPDRRARVLWTSTETEDALADALNPGADVGAFVRRKSFLPADARRCSIPAGIFRGWDGVLLQVIAFGPSFEQAGEPAVRVHTQSAALTILGTPGPP